MVTTLAAARPSRMPRDVGDELKVVVLTGGPGGGKSTLMRELHADSCERDRWIMIGEAAPLLVEAGLDVNTQEFQIAVVEAQIALENACARAARSGRHILCARGSLDPLAYWMRRGWSEDAFFDRTLSREAHLRRYSGIIHLQTAAIAAEAHYRAYPQAPRRETSAEAAELDRLCERAWCGHRRFIKISCAADWADKARTAREALACIADERA